MNKISLEDRIWNSKLEYSIDHLVDRDREIYGVYLDFLKNGDIPQKVLGVVGGIIYPIMATVTFPLGVLINLNSDGIYYEPLLQGYIMTNELREIRKKRGSDPKSRELEFSKK